LNKVKVEAINQARLEERITNPFEELRSAVASLVDAD